MTVPNLFDGTVIANEVRRPVTLLQIPINGSAAVYTFISFKNLAPEKLLVL